MKHAKLGTLQRLSKQYPGVACASMFSKGLDDWYFIFDKIDNVDEIINFLDFAKQSNWSERQLFFVNNAFEKSLFNSAFFRPNFFPFLSKYIKTCKRYNYKQSLPADDILKSLNRYLYPTLEHILTSYIDMDPLVKSLILAPLVNESLCSSLNNPRLPQLLEQVKTWTQEEQQWFSELSMRCLDGNKSTTNIINDNIVTLMSTALGQHRKQEIENALNMSNCLGISKEDSIKTIFNQKHNMESFDVQDIIN